MTTHGRLPGYPFELLQVIAIERLICRTPAGGHHHVDGNVVTSPFIGQGSGEAANGLFGSVVGQPVATAIGAVHRGEVDDAASAGLDEPGKRGLSGPE
ncbi:hypothetical protein D3C80_1619910 [compost metagenome]